MACYLFAVHNDSDQGRNLAIMSEESSSRMVRMRMLSHLPRQTHFTSRLFPFPKSSFPKSPFPKSPFTYQLSLQSWEACN